MDYRALGRNIKRERRSQNLTQEQLAELVNISTVFLSQIETANRIPSLDTAYKISSCLNVPLDNLINDMNSSIKTDIDYLLTNRTSKEKQFISNVVRTILSSLKDDRIFL